MNSKISYDLIVIGSGPGGYVAAIRAAQLGLKTAIIEKEKLGGICLNWGCIPTKALLRAAELHRNIKESDLFGINIDKFSYNWKQIVERSREVAGQLSKGVEHLLKKNNIDVIDGHGQISGPGRVIVNNIGSEDLYESSNIILATGARPKYIDGLNADNKNIWNYKDAMIPEKLPKSILIVGAGAIGIEFASFYNAFGCDVTLVEAQKNILPSEDEEISIYAKEQFINDGIKILNNTKINKIFSNKNIVSAEITLEDGNVYKEKYSKAILAMGIQANIEDIGLDTVDIKTDQKRIITDVHNQTTVKGIYAIGDLTGAPWLAHKASHEGIHCVEHICGSNKNLNTKKIIPACTYSRPQIASIGLTEKAAKEKGININIGKFPLIGNGKAIALGDSNGFVKTIFNKDNGELIGAHMIGPEVTELISSYAVAMQLEATEIDLFNTIFPHPTVSESIHESVLDAYDRAIHI